MPAISAELFKKSFTTTPQSVSPSIVSLCQKVSPDNNPIWVNVRPDREAISNECFNNVSATTTREGGTIVYGWLIWEWPRVFIEAEHHEIWQKDNELVDITPHVEGEQTVLFLPDPNRVYDYVGLKRIINVKRSLGMFPSVERWIDASEAFQQAVEDNSIGSQAFFDRAQIVYLESEFRNALASVFVDLATNTKVNDTCFCTSGRKFKKCCATLIDLSR